MVIVRGCLAVPWAIARLRALLVLYGQAGRAVSTTKRPMRTLFLILMLAPCLALAQPQLTPAQQDSARNAAFRTLGNLPTKQAAYGLQVSAGEELNYMRAQMRKYSTQKSTGTALQVAGILIGGFTFAIIAQDDVALASKVAIGGGVVVLIGGIVSLDANKYMRRIGIGVSGTGANVSYTF